jgi:hypothetical protein
MIELENGLLRVEVLHPSGDARRLGSRYCHGGFVWQVSEHRRGEAGPKPLLSGPVFPAEPPVFDGQGLPEAFQPLPIVPGGGASAATKFATVPGVGRVSIDEADPTPDGSGAVRGKLVLEALEWAVTVAPSRTEVSGYPPPPPPPSPSPPFPLPLKQLPVPTKQLCAVGLSMLQVRMEATQPLGSGRGTLRLVKTVVLSAAVVHCGTELELLGSSSAEAVGAAAGGGVSLSWFAHPFFPLTPDGRVCTFAHEARLSIPSGGDGPVPPRSFFYDSAQRLCMDRGFNWAYAKGGGSFVQLGGVAGHRLRAQTCDASFTRGCFDWDSHVLKPVLIKKLLICGNAPADFTRRVGLWVWRATLPWTACRAGAVRAGQSHPPD